MKFKKIVYPFFALFLIFFFMFFYVKNLENKTLFSPQKELKKYPSELNYGDFYFDSKGFLLNGWLVKVEKPKFIILFCHGNAGNISTRMEKIKFFNEINCDIFIFDYKGYGKSSGKPTEEGIYEDAVSAYGFLISRGYKENEIIGYGESLGSAVIIDLASKKKLKAIIIEGGFSSGKDMANYIYPYIPFWLSSIKLNSDEKIKDIKIPKLFIHSHDDVVVPYELGYKLYKIAPEPKDFLKVSGTHSNCFEESKEIIKEKILNFFDKL